MVMNTVTFNKQILPVTKHNNVIVSLVNVKQILFKRPLGRVEYHKTQLSRSNESACLIHSSLCFFYIGDVGPN